MSLAEHEKDYWFCDDPSSIKKPLTELKRNLTEKCELKADSESSMIYYFYVAKKIFSDNGSGTGVKRFSDKLPARWEYEINKVDNLNTNLLKVLAYPTTNLDCIRGTIDTSAGGTLSSIMKDFVNDQKLSSIDSKNLHLQEIYIGFEAQRLGLNDSVGRTNELLDFLILANQAIVNTCEEELTQIMK